MSSHSSNENDCYSPPRKPISDAREESAAPNIGAVRVFVPNATKKAKLQADKQKSEATYQEAVIARKHSNFVIPTAPQVLGGYCTSERSARITQQNVNQSANLQRKFAEMERKKREKAVEEEKYMKHKMEQRKKAESWEAFSKKKEDAEKRNIRHLRAEHFTQPHMLQAPAAPAAAAAPAAEAHRTPGGTSESAKTWDKIHRKRDEEKANVAAEFDRKKSSARHQALRLAEGRRREEEARSEEMRRARVVRFGASSSSRPAQGKDFTGGGE